MTRLTAAAAFLAATLSAGAAHAQVGLPVVDSLVGTNTGLIATNIVPIMTAVETTSANATRIATSSERSADLLQQHLQVTREIKVIISTPVVAAPGLAAFNASTLVNPMPIVADVQAHIGGKTPPTDGYAKVMYELTKVSGTYPEAKMLNESAAANAYITQAALDNLASLEKRASLTAAMKDEIAASGDVMKLLGLIAQMLVQQQLGVIQTAQAVNLGVLAGTRSAHDRQVQLRQRQDQYEETASFWATKIPGTVAGFSAGAIAP